MPLTPKSPRAPSRLPRTPSTPVLPRVPKRIVTTPKRVKHEAKRMPSPPQPSTPTRTPRRAVPTTPRSILRNPSTPTRAMRAPKRAADPDTSRGVVKKRVVGELSARRVKPSSGPTPSETRGKSVTGAGPKGAENALARSKSDTKLNCAKKQKHIERSPGTEKDPAKDASGTRNVRNGASSNTNKGQPKIKSAKSVSDVPRAENKATRKNVKVKAQESKPAMLDTADQQENRSSPKASKAKKKRPNAGRFDLQLPDVDAEEKVLVTAPKKPTGNERKDANAGVVSPKITINERMSESKLQLLESSPLNRLIPEKDRKAAAAEVAAQKIASARKEGKPESGLDSKDPFVPLDSSARTEEETVEYAENEAARKKEARKLKWKARQMRMRGSLPNGEELSKKAGFLYLGHIPHGFYEKEMRLYFSQFGEVTRVRLSRSKKTARSRGFAFLEFADAEVASIAAEAMDGYLMHGQALVAKVVPDDKVHPDTFKGANRTFRKIPWSSIERREMIARAKDPLKLAARSRRVKKLSKEKAKSLSKKGIKYDFPEISL